MQAKDPSFLQAAERNYQTVMGLYGRVPGGMFGADENCRRGYHGPRQGAETCSMVEFMHSDQMLLKITGDPKFADRCEYVAFNSLPCAMTPDLKGLHYITSPNAALLDRVNKAPGIQNGGCMLAYNPYEYRCCQHNVAHGWPYYAEHLWLATPGNGLAAVLYAPCKVTAKVADGTQVTITETTDYPFGDKVELKVSTPKTVRFPLALRVPRWCDAPKLAVNGRPVQANAVPLSYIVIGRDWADGDVVSLQLPMKLTLTVWDSSGNSASVNRGPLTYSLKIGERWVRYGGTDKWPALECYPTTPWNYGLLIDEKWKVMTDGVAVVQQTGPLPWDYSYVLTDRAFEVVQKPGPIPKQPFTIDAAPIELRAKAKKIPAWKLDARGLINELQPSPAKSDEPVETVTLIPMGCARLRISAFPTIGSGPDARDWAMPPTPPLASHCFANDTVTALNDGLLPRSSSDQDIPRFTWWDHKGTDEWVAYTFEKPRRISQVEVYWFDDTGRGGCRVPASWRVVARQGNELKPVTGAGTYAVEKDKFNKVTFDAIETTEIRLEVKLQPGFSGGILEWRSAP
jgi:hypothetical protein